MKEEGDAGARGEKYPCPLKGAIEIITKKWTCQIISLLGNYKSLRYTEILEELEGISPRTLSYRLKELESAALINRRSFNEIPPRVEYSLTGDGVELRELMKPIMEWATLRQ
jgi:DNA-binding HxlR family transcriptional regulator